MREIVKREVERGCSWRLGERGMCYIGWRKFGMSESYSNGAWEVVEGEECIYTKLNVIVRKIRLKTFNLEKKNY